MHANWRSYQRRFNQHSSDAVSTHLIPITPTSCLAQATRPSATFLLRIRPTFVERIPSSSEVPLGDPLLVPKMQVTFHQSRGAKVKKKTRTTRNLKIRIHQLANVRLIHHRRTGLHHPTALSHPHYQVVITPLAHPRLASRNENVQSSKPKSSSCERNATPTSGRLKLRR